VTTERWNPQIDQLADCFIVEDEIDGTETSVATETDNPTTPAPAPETLDKIEEELQTTEPAPETPAVQEEPEVEPSTEPANEE